MASLSDTLRAFQERANDNTRVKTLIRSWKRKIVVKSDTSSEVFTMRVEQGRIADVATGDHGDDESIMLSAREEIILAVFSGAKNPAREYTDGRLTVLGDESDKMKLDAICFVLWGDVP